MYQEPRPTCVTVIGWAWIIVGALMIFSGAMGFLALAMMPDHSPNQESVPIFLRIFPVLAFVQICFAGLGLYSGIQFLRLRAWSRNVLEGLTWVLLLFMIAFSIYWVIGWLDMSSAGPHGYGLIGAAMGVVMTAFYGLPLGIMLKYLRGAKVRNAVAHAA